MSEPVASTLHTLVINSCKVLLGRGSPEYVEIPNTWATLFDTFQECLSGLMELDVRRSLGYARYVRWVGTFPIPVRVWMIGDGTAYGHKVALFKLWRHIGQVGQQELPKLDVGF